MSFSTQLGWDSRGDTVPLDSPVFETGWKQFWIQSAGQRFRVRFSLLRGVVGWQRYGLMYSIMAPGMPDGWTLLTESSPWVKLVPSAWYADEDPIAVPRITPVGLDFAPGRGMSKKPLTPEIYFASGNHATEIEWCIMIEPFPGYTSGIVSFAPTEDGTEAGMLPWVWPEQHYLALTMASPGDLQILLDPIGLAAEGVTSLAGRIGNAYEALEWVTASSSGVILVGGNCWSSFSLGCAASGEVRTVELGGALTAALGDLALGSFGVVDHIPVVAEASGVIDLAGASEGNVWVQGYDGFSLARTVEIGLSASGGVQPSRSGQLAAGLDAITGASEGNVWVQGYDGFSLARTVELSLATEGQLAIKGEVLATLGLITAESSGVVGHVPIVGNLAAAIDDVSLVAFTGVLARGDSGSMIDLGLTVEGESPQTASGSLNVATEAVQLTAQGGVKVEGNVAADCWVELQGEFERVINASASETLDGMTLVTDGAVAVSGDGVTATVDIGCSSTGVVPAVIGGALQITLDDLLADSDGAVSVGGEMIGLLTTVFRGEYLRSAEAMGNAALVVTLDDVTSESDGAVSLEGDGTGALDDLTVDASGALDVMGDADAELDLVELESDGAVAITGDMSGSLTATFRGEYVRSAEAPGTGTLSVTLEDVAIAGEGQCEAGGDLDASLDDLLLESDGEAKHGRRLAFIA
jgi:hypothetical protein